MNTPTETPFVLDAACGSRMFWFDRNDPRAIFADNRIESHILKDRTVPSGLRSLEIKPAVMADFTAMPYPNNTFSLVVFDPPHLVVFDPPHLTVAEPNGWQAKKYGRLEGNWREMLRQGFAECFRVLRPAGTLIFKWNEHNVPVVQILALTPNTPLFGQRCGKTAKTHWLVFMKTEVQS